MNSTVLHLLIAALLSFTPLRADEQKPPAELFGKGPLEFVVDIPDSFGMPVETDTAYLTTDAGKAPYRELTWKHEKDTLVIRWTVLPEAAWQGKTPKEMFANAKALLTRQENVQLITDRDYKVGESPAHSFVFSVTGAKPGFQRIDYVLTKPEMNVVIYASPTREAIEGKTCEGIFTSISTTPRAPKK